MRAKRIRLGAGVAGALLLVLSARPAAAQNTPSANQPASTPDVIHACYVPSTGTVYRIKEPGLQQQCSGPQQGPNQHVEFSWNEQGPQGEPGPEGEPGEAGPPGPPGTTDHSQLINLSNDDHLHYLLTEGVRNSPGGFAVTGSFTGGGNPPVSGAGTRLMWVSERAAFRAGGVTGAHWNGGNIGDYSVALGQNAVASGNHSTAIGFDTRATGVLSTAFGNNTRADAAWSTVMGNHATTGQRLGAFVYGDRSTVDPIHAAAHNQFVVRAQHIWLGTNNLVSAIPGRFLETSTGAFLSTGGDWTNASSRLAKENFRPMDAEQVLRRVAELEVPSWNYKAEEPRVRHVGPIAQDFHRAFGLGGSEEAISTVDLGGINMLAIQALERRTRELREKADRIERLEAEVVELQAARAELERRLDCLDALPRR